MIEPSKSLKRATHNILPCPLCDENAKLMPLPDSSWWRVRCKNYDCGCTTWALQTKIKAITAWNRRSRGTAT